MALVRMNRSRPVVSGSFFNDFDRMFNELANSTRSYNESFNYPADLYETDDHLVLEMVIPGLKAEDLDISVEDRKLTIKGSFKKEVTEDNAEENAPDRRYWMQSIARNDFSRSLKLPNRVDVDAINAQVENGILKLSMPKIAEAKVRKIEVLS